jgi:murein DD-endopeptidase MepM/ murein hydrolase activator NlpD
MRRRSLALLGLAFLLVAAGPAAGQGIEREKTLVDSRIAVLQAEIEASKEEEGVLTSQLSAIAAELEGAEAAVSAAQSNLDAVEADLASAQARLRELTDLLAEQARSLERLQAEYATAVAILEARVRAIYVSDPPDLLSFLVSAATFDELVDNVEFLGRIGAQDERIAQQVKTAKERAAAERLATARTRELQTEAVSAISARASDARAARDRLASERDTLSHARAVKRSALAQSQESREEYLHEVEALAAQSAALEASIQEAQAGAGSTGTGSPSAAGLIWPVSGPVVSGYGMRWGRMHEGIDIAAASGTPIVAAAPGTVIHAGWLGGYGNLVVVDHGYGLATAYAHASSILVGVGQQVSQGETIALVGSTGNSSGPHLHFEVRVNGVAVDPLGYL